GAVAARAAGRTRAAGHAGVSGVRDRRDAQRRRGNGEEPVRPRTGPAGRSARSSADITHAVREPVAGRRRRITRTTDSGAGRCGVSLTDVELDRLADYTVDALDPREA